MSESFVDQDGNHWRLDLDWVGFAHDYDLPFHPDPSVTRWIDPDEINALRREGTTLAHDVPRWEKDANQLFAIAQVEARANFAAQFANDDFTPQSVNDRAHIRSVVQPLNNDLGPQSVNNEASVESGVQPINNEIMDQELSNSDGQNEVQAGSTTQPSNHKARDVSEAEKHARYAAEYLNHDDTDDESSDGSEAHFDLFNSNFPMIGQSYLPQTPQETICSLSVPHFQYSNLKSEYIVPPASAAVRDPTNRVADTTKAAFDVIEQISSASGSASHPIIVDDDLDSLFDSASQNPQGPPTHQSPAESVSHAPGSIHHEATVSNPKKRVEHPDSSDDEQPVATNPKRLRIAAPTPKRRNIAKVLRQSSKLGPAEHNLSTQQRAVSLVEQSPVLPTQQPVASPIQNPNPATAPSQAPSGQSLFANRAQSEEAAASRRTIAYNWTPPQNDASVPQDPEHRASYIKMLVDTFKSTDECLDSTNMSSFQSRWVPLGTAGSASTTTEQQIEAISWKLLDIAESLHTHGPASLEIYDEAKLKATYKTRNLTFSQRVDQICALLRLSKARCEKILKFENLDMVVAAPEQLVKEIKVNKKQNQIRQKHLKMGREVKKRKEVAHRTEEQQRRKEHNQLVQEHKNLEPLQKNKDTGRKLRKKIQVYRDAEPKPSEEQVVGALPQVVETPPQVIEASSQAFEAPSQASQGTASPLFEAAPSQLFEAAPSDLFEAPPSQPKFFQTALQGFDTLLSQGVDARTPQLFNTAPLPGFNATLSHHFEPRPSQLFDPAQPDFFEPDPLQFFDPAILQNFGAEQQEAAQQVGEGSSQFVGAEQQHSEQQAVRPPPDDIFALNFPGQNYFPPSSRGIATGCPEGTIDPALLSKTTQSDFDAPIPSAAWPHRHNSMHGYDQQAQFPLKELSLGASAFPPVLPSMGVQQHLHASLPPPFIALQNYNQQSQDYMQQPQVPSEQISYGGHTYVQASSLGAGSMPLATNVGAENRPLESRAANNGGPKRSRDVAEDSVVLGARPAKRQNRNKRN